MTLADTIRENNGPNAPLGSRYRLWFVDPAGALELAFIEAEEKGRSYAFMGMTAADAQKLVRYFRYGAVTRASLEGREYEIEFWDGQVSLHFTDFDNKDLRVWPDIYKRNSTEKQHVG